MDYRSKYYEEAKKAFLKDVTETVCKEQEDPAVCISKNLKAFDSVFYALEEQLKMEDKLLREFKIREREGANPLMNKPFDETKFDI